MKLDTDTHGPQRMNVNNMVTHLICLFNKNNVDSDLRLDASKVLVLVLLDLSAAFDTVGHKIRGWSKTANGVGLSG